MARRTMGIGVTALVAAFCFVPAALAREERVSLDNVPKAVMDTVKARFASARVKGAGKETEKSKLVYEITLDEKGRNVDVTLTPAGELLLIEKVIDKAELPVPVVQSLSSKYPGATYAVAEEIVEVDQGHEHLAFYEVALATSDGRKREVKIKPDGSTVTEDEEEDEAGEYGDDD